MFESVNGQTEGTSANQLDAKQGLDAMLSAQLALNPVEAQNPVVTSKHLSAAHLEGAAGDTSGTSAAGGNLVDNSLLHLGSVAVKATTRGFLEPAAGVIQLGEQVANSVTENTPGLRQSFFSPEKFAPTQSSSAAKYSGEWFVQTVFENVGKVPWYILAAKTLTRAPGMATEAGVLSEGSLLGINVKTASMSGLIMGAAGPTAIQKDGLWGSLKERALQGSIGFGQMALMTLGTTGLSKTVAAGESMFAARGESLVAGEALSGAVPLGSSIYKGIGSTALRMGRNASIASIGSIPAGLAAGYVNARAHGTKFEATENVIATMTVGFGLGLTGGGKAPEGVARRNATSVNGDALSTLDAMPVVEHFGAPIVTPESAKLAKLQGENVTVTRQTLPGGKVIETYTHPDGKIVEHHMPGSIPEWGNSIFTRYPDGRTEQRNSQWTFTEKPDGTTIYSDSYRTGTTHKDGTGFEVNTPAAEAYRDWFDISQAEKVQVLAKLDQVPHGGDLVNKIVERALFSTSDPVVQEAALPGIKKIAATADQVEAWQYAWGCFPEMRAELFKMIPELNPETQQSVMLGRGAAQPDGSGTRSKAIDLLKMFNERQGGSEDKAGSNSGNAVEEYLKLVQPLPEAIRLKIYSALDPLLRTGPENIPAREQAIEPLIARINEGLESGDPLVTSAFGEFSGRQLVNPMTRLAPTEVNRVGVPAISEVGTAATAKLSQFQDIFKTPNAWETKVNQFLDQNPEMAVQKSIYEWASKQPDKSIQRVVDSALSLDRLKQTYRNLMKDAPLKHSEEYETIAAPTKFIERAKAEAMSTTQVRETLQNVVQLLEIAQKYPGMNVANDFRMAGLQALRQAADPLIITQGNHPTCALASLETSIYKNNPAEATRLVNEVLRTGKFVTTDGTTITVDPLTLKPEPNSLTANKTKFHDQNEIQGYRSYASQVFQNTSANIYWQRQTETPYLKSATPPGRQNVAVGSIHYEMHQSMQQGNPAVHDQLVYHNNGKRTVLGSGPSITTLREVQDIGRQIGGESTVPTVIPPRSPVTASRASLETYLQSLTPKQFPVIIGIDANAMINPAKPDINLNHAVSLLLSPEGQVYIHNTWQPFSDVHEAGKWIPNAFSLGRLMDLMGLK